jgi:hypothetical protein
LRDRTLPEDAPIQHSGWPRGVTRADAPWLVRGDAYILLTTSEREVNVADAGIDSALEGIYNNLFNAMVVADYRESPIGPFRELLYIPGRFRFGFDDEPMSITRGYANSEAGLWNRRAHWGVPAQFAEITRQPLPTQGDHFAVGATSFASFSFEVFGPDQPLNGKVIPRAFRSIGQRCDDVTLLYTFAITGTMRAARFIPHAFDSSMFPDMAKREFVACIKICDFLAEFPLVSTMAWTTA